MNNEQNVRANDLDSLIGDNHLQMMKAALPYMNVSQQRFISYFVKINELQRTYADPAEQDFIDLIINFFQGFKLAGSFSDPVPSSTIPVQAQSEGQGRQTNQNNQNNQNNQANNHRQNNPFGRMSFDQLKNFMPPEQQSRFETMQLMMSAMQQMN